MQKFMFDTNAFTALINSPMDWTTFFQSRKREIEFIITSVQIEELAEISDAYKEKRVKHFLCLCSMNPKLIPTMGVVGYTRLGLSIFGGGEEVNVYDSLLNKEKNNICDAIIGAAAYREKCILITDDKRFRKKLISNGINTKTFEEFCDYLKKLSTSTVDSPQNDVD